MMRHVLYISITTCTFMLSREPASALLFSVSVALIFCFTCVFFLVRFSLFFLSMNAIVFWLWLSVSMAKCYFFLQLANIVHPHECLIHDLYSICYDFECSYSNPIKRTAFMAMFISYLRLSPFLSFRIKNQVIELRPAFIYENLEKQKFRVDCDSCCQCRALFSVWIFVSEKGQ